MKVANIRIPHTLAGIPCIVHVIEAEVQQPDPYADNDIDYHGWSDFNYRILDRRGYPAPWLERKASKSDLLGIEFAVNSLVLS